jgi:hypothetical protein
VDAVLKRLLAGDAAVWSPLRFTAAAVSLTAAAAHLPVTEDYLHEAAYIGILFIVLSVACVLEAVALLRRDTRGVWIAVASTCGAAVVGYVWSRAIGLPQIADDVGNWTEPLGVVSIAAEAVAVACAAVTLAGRRNLKSLRRRGPVAAGMLALVIGLSSTAAAARAPSGQRDMNSMGDRAMMGSGYWNAVGGGPFHSNGRTRTYYISADQVVWNYAPDRHNDITGRPFDETAATYVKTGPGRIGSRYLKCLYRGYTDGSFTHRVPRPADQQYLGLLGPVIHAQVGDTIRVVFRNTCPFPASVHPHGLFYDKDSEGAPYDDGTPGAEKTDDAVPTGGRHTYTWLVPGRAGPGPGDGSSVMWMYHSHTDEVTDTYAGLMGPIEVTRADMARPDGSPNDVDREVFALFSVMNENKSPYFEQNLHRFARPPHPDTGDEDFTESNLKHSINGYVYGNMPMITMRKGERVRWYVMSMGTEVDLHTPHWHGNDVTVNGIRMDVVNLLPASMVVADMVPDNVGIWLFHCHVNDHLTAGMITRYRVLP